MINHQSNEISIRSRKLQQQVELLECYFNASAMLCQSRITDRKGKVTTNFLPVCEKMDRKQIFDAFSVVHESLSLRPDPVIEGMVNTLNSKFRTKQV